MNSIDCLMKLGLTRHESSLYLLLCREGDLTGYEAAKISGIQRSNTYLALAGLLDKGAVNKVDGDPARYVALLPEEFIINTKRQFEEIFDYLKDNLPSRAYSSEPYITISGRANIINKMKNVILNSTERIYLSMFPREIELIEKELLNAIERGLKVVVITSPGFKLQGATIYYHEKQQGQIRIIADSSDVLTGELNSNNDATCLYSRNINLIQLIKDSLVNEIKLIKLQK